MKNRGGILVLAVFAILILAAGVMAGFEYVDNSITVNYQAGEEIRGSVDLTLDEEPLNSLFTSTFPGNITLFELLDKNNLREGVHFTCSPSGCGAAYVETGEVTTTGLSGESLVGFKITGDNIVVTSAKLRVISDIGPSCSSQLLIDVLDDDESFIYSKDYTSNVCAPKDVGCFDDDIGTYEDATLTNVRYCETLSLPAAPAFEIGAAITNSSDEFDVTMELYNSNWNFLGDCELPEYTSTSSRQSLGCVVNYTNIDPADYFVCVFADDGDYKIRTESSGDTCGTDDFDSSTNSDFNLDYEIFGSGMQYSDFDVLIDDDSFFEINGDSLGKNMVEAMNDYVQDVYGGDCPGNGCLIPFLIEGGNQDLVFSDVEIKYTRGSTTLTSNTLFSLDREDSKISTEDGENVTVDLRHADFTIPIGSEEDRFELFLDGEEVFGEDISIAESFSFDIEPKVVLIGLSTDFRVVTTFNITEYGWDFGDGGVSTAKNPSHTYLVEGDYDVVVSLSRSDGATASRTFTVTVGDAETSARNLIAVYRDRVNRVAGQLDSFDSWVKPSVESKVNINTINSTLAILEVEFANASTEQDYQDIVTSLIAMNVPSAVDISREGDLDLGAGFSGIDVGHLESISQETVALDKVDELEGTIVSWFNDNYEASAGFFVITAFTDSGDSDLYTQYAIDIGEKGSVGESFLILDQPMSDIIFMQDYGAMAVGSGTYIPLSGSQNIEFLVPEFVSIQELGAYIAPPISELGRYSDIDFIESQFPLGLFILWLAVLIVSVLIVWVLLQEWYKRNYEKHLFRNSDQVYNLINFIYNARKSGLKDREIRERLKKNGWNGEQIRYGMRKIDGKRTGMWEIPLFKFFENKRVEDEIKRRHEGKVDARFIKRPAF